MAASAQAVLEDEAHRLDLAMHVAEPETPDLPKPEDSLHPSTDGSPRNTTSNDDPKEKAKMATGKPLKSAKNLRAAASLPLPHLRSMTVEAHDSQSVEDGTNSVVRERTRRQYSAETNEMLSSDELGEGDVESGGVEHTREHVMQLHDFAAGALNWCNVCKKPIANQKATSAHMCTICRYIAHNECTLHVAKSCPITFLSKPLTEHQKPILRHHWVQGNLAFTIPATFIPPPSPTTSPSVSRAEDTTPSPSATPAAPASYFPSFSLGSFWGSGMTCMKCEKAIKEDATTPMSGHRCYWCKAVVHNKCLNDGNLLTAACDMGPHRDLLLPPYALVMQSVEEEKEEAEEEKEKEKEGEGEGELEKAGREERELVKSQERKGKTVALRVDPSVLSASCRPLLVFTNKMSGGQTGAEVMQKLSAILNPHQLIELTAEGPLVGLKRFLPAATKHSGFRILVCGGDGTVNWVCAGLDELGLNTEENKPSIAVLPLGTGNDLSGFLNWGVNYDRSDLRDWLRRVERSICMPLDRWRLTISTFNPPEKQVDVRTFHHSFSIGVDAKISMEFHMARVASPDKFNSRFLNKYKYFEAGVLSILEGWCHDLSKCIEYLEVDDKIYRGDELPSSIESLIISNIPAYADGTDMWGLTKPKRQWKPQKVDDHCIEVLAHKGSIHLIEIKVGVAEPIRFGQGKHVRLKTKEALPVQMDGEPWIQPPCDIQLEHCGYLKMLVPSEAKPTLNRRVSKWPESNLAKQTQLK